MDVLPNVLNILTLSSTMTVGVVVVLVEPPGALRILVELTPEVVALVAVMGVETDFPASHSSVLGMKPSTNQT